MAKKKIEAIEPVISSIPVPPSDSALVIDLPDGQKLLVGKIEAGTVIEVATWRGTGRPDSRTNRLMLGMSNETDAKKPDSVEEAPPLTSKGLKFPDNVIFILTKFVRLFIKAVKRFSISVIKIIKNVDFKNFKIKNIRIPNLKFKNRIKINSESIQASNALKIEEDFDLDFQRILDEVSQRRNSQSKPAKPNGASTGKIGQKSNKGKSGPKKGRKPAK